MAFAQDTKPPIAVEVVNEIADFIDEVRTSVMDLNDECIHFIEKYDRYNDKHIYDASLLKERMKAAVVRAVSDEL